MEIPTPIDLMIVLSSEIMVSPLETRNQGENLGKEPVYLVKSTNERGS